jgi:hypothetical protein
MKFRNLVYLIILLKTGNCYSQTDQSAKYYDSLAKVLADKPGIQSFKLKSRKYNGGKPKTLYYTVKYSNDSLQRTWVVGQVVEFYKSGQLKEKLDFDNDSKLTNIPHIRYRKDGSIKHIIVFKPDSVEYSLLKIDNANYYYPDRVVFSRYKNGEKSYSIERQYDYEQGKYRSDGLSYFYYYSRNSTLIFEEKYKMGKRVSKKVYRE